MTQTEWIAEMDRINGDPATMKIRRDIEAACRKYLAHIRRHGVGAALRVVVDPLLARDV